jgi:dipeptidyl aminopeptidase/acylaminoacyl peptidase
MAIRVPGVLRSASKRSIHLAPSLFLLLLSVPLIGQQAPAPAAPSSQKAPRTWADDLLERETYATPPPELADAVLAPRYRNVTLSNISPDRKWFVDEIGDGPVPMKTFAKPFHELGGVFVDFRANRARALTIRNNAGLQVIAAADGAKRTIQVPPGARVSNPTWSPDSRAVAYLAHTEDATHLFVADIVTGQSRQLTKTPLLATLVSTFEYTADGRHIAVVLVPDGRPPMPAAPAAPTGPTVKIADPERNRLRTFPSLLSTVYEKELLEWHATGQLALADVGTRALKKIGQPAMIRAIDASPDGRYVRVTRIVKPFSYDVPVSNFGTIEEVWDAADGRVLAELNARPINLGVQDDTQPPDPAQPPAAGGGRGAQQTGKREIAWRTDNQGLTFLEQDPPPPGGEDNRAGRGRGAGTGTGDEPATPGQGRGAQPPRPDRVYHWLPPFSADTKKVVYENNSRISGHRYSPDVQVLFFSERQGPNTIDSAVYLNEPSREYTLARYRTEDVYANPGSLLGARGTVSGGGRGGGGRGGVPAGTGPVLLSADGGSVFFQGTLNDRNPAGVGPKTFVDRVAIRTGEKRRVFESENNDVFERLTAVLDPDAGRFVVSREGPREIPQQYLLENGQRRQLTQNVDVTPDLTKMRVERFTVTRADGFTFRVTVNLPANHDPASPPPALFWFYPREFTDQEAYDRPDRTFNKNSFQTFGTRSMEFFVRLGYAVIEPDAPIVGPQGAMNDNYVHDLRNNLAAVIDELDRRRFADRQRLAIGGHSYGAFSAVNAMVHTPFFRAGIAGDGAYNRTLTPLGFQSERRDLWEAPHVYLNMSPFLYANNLTGALLMYHGLADQNVGTDPTNSIRLYHALNGLGKTTALYLYPLEDHGPASRETLLDLWARWAAWLDKYVKNPQRTEKKTTTTTSSASAGR